ncbi:hypothetical protein CH306_02925 [Rhodococcus sp. 15-725-2-2b]|nr:hypothetical protein CH276_07900 [Rhodococcus sp. 06-470-2]OZC72626.1 hypothetical protein CH277_01200 [Rhodococcus sp. 06-469-3-2]OZC76883.1 hypothetical protein CH274_19575 [Rhodococcus sp. 06-418-5]OZD48852.1 hypothetical protein CH264_06425 [Rhodococcus sp. 06-1477-1A]OZD81435.1 hypothetical protein CH273_11990 [Rhodococcus sp. 05-339-2]OZE58764.1 hypothetical protein CH265_22185 [Rhodococcus sp. 05-2221-1B]OZE77636.1 hypothetical protein CH306_02925 [Rhodococcus sp. 15-725-2-2b]OZF38
MFVISMCLPRFGPPGTLCDMEHITHDRKMSDNELRKAIGTLQQRADDARKRGAADDAARIERTIADYRDEMSQRL